MVTLNESLTDIWESSATPCIIIEDYLDEGIKSEVDGKIILGKIVGPAFFGEGVSRNRRFYPRAVWEKQLANPTIKERLANRTMLGCIGHADHPVTEEDVTTGKVSHIVTKMILQEDNQGIAEMLVLNTPAGRNLYTLMKAGSKLKVSTRAQGKFLEGKTHEGMPVVDPDSFILETIDFVIAPGFIETDPKLQESLRSITEKVHLLESKGNSQLNTSNNLSYYTEENKEKNQMNEELLNEVKKTNSIYEGLYKEQKKLREEAEEEAKKAEEEKEEVEKELEECKRQLAKYRALGEADELTQMIKEYNELGITSPTEARFILETLKEEAEDAIDAEEVEDLKKDIEESMKLLAQYEELGTPEELADIKDKAEELVDELEKKEIEESVKRLSKKFGLRESLIRRIFEEAEDKEKAEETIEDIAKEVEAKNEEDEGCNKEDCDDADKEEKDGFRRFSNTRRKDFLKRRKDRLEGMADAPKTTVDDYEDDHNLPNKVNDNDVEAVPNVVDEMLDSLINKKGSGRVNSMLENYKPGAIVNSMFS